MKTKEFIKMLQEADPEGEGYVRLSGGIPKFAEAKPGYYDGPYSYIDEEGNWVKSIKGYKVDIYQMDIYDFVSDLCDDDTQWEDVEKKFKFEFHKYVNEEQKCERANAVLQEAREAYVETMDFKNQWREKNVRELSEKSDRGWTWFQNKDVDLNQRPNLHVYYTWKIIDEKGVGQPSNLNNNEAVVKSGLWERHDNGVMPGYYQWIKK